MRALLTLLVLLQFVQASQVVKHARGNSWERVTVYNGLLVSTAVTIGDKATSLSEASAGELIAVVNTAALVNQQLNAALQKGAKLPPNELKQPTALLKQVRGESSRLMLKATLKVQNPKDKYAFMQQMQQLIDVTDVLLRTIPSLALDPSPPPVKSITFIP